MSGHNLFENIEKFDFTLYLGKDSQIRRGDFGRPSEVVVRHHGALESYKGKLISGRE